MVQAAHRLLDITGAPDTAWFLAVSYLADIHNICFDPTIHMVPKQKRHGVTVDISAYLQHAFWDPILYYDHEASWPATKERSGRWVGVCKNVGDVLTYWIVDDQTKQLLARSVVRPFLKNRRVKWDPEFICTPVKSTAHNGGDLRPPAEEVKQLLDNLLDKYDEAEPEPQPNPTVETDTKIGTQDSILKNSGKYDQLDQGMDVTQPFVPCEEEDPYDGPSKLRYGNNPLPMHPEIEATKITKKLIPRDTKYKTDYTPRETDIYDPTIKTEIPQSNQDIILNRGAPTKKPKVRRSQRLRDKDNPDIIQNGGMVKQGSKWRRSIRLMGKGEPEKQVRSLKATKWVPSNASQFFKLGKTMAKGVLFLPTHVIAEPSVTLPSIPCTGLILNPIVQEPTSKTKQLNNLRAYHAVLDKWNSIQDPSPMNYRWSLYKVLADRDRKSVV